MSAGHPMYGGKSLPRKMPAAGQRHQLVRFADVSSSEDEDSSDDEVAIDQGGIIPESELDIIH